jgi:predicted TIM-barrel fold metal-dependent hydrolase
MAPGTTALKGMPPLQDPYYAPFWAACDRLGLAVVIHAGYGHAQGEITAELERISRLAQTSSSADALNDLVNNAEQSFFARDVRSRQAMWQVMLGGVFDRHPNLKLMVTEVRADWVPATLARLDTWFEREVTPMKRKPTEYWQANCLAGASFIHRAEVDMRHQIGVAQLMFGRDYPHAEGTWPATSEWLRDAFRGVPLDDTRQILGENAIRALGLDRERLAGIAKRLAVASGGGEDDPSVDPRYLEIFQRRGGYLKPAEDVDVDEIDRSFSTDLAACNTTPSS